MELVLGEKIRAARTAAGVSQAELAKRIGVTLRSVQYYEKDSRVPKNATMIIKIAAALGIETNYFMSTEQLAQAEEQDKYLQEAEEQYGSRGKARANLVLRQASALFAGGELSEDDREEFIRTMMEIYFDSKKKAKKFAPQSD